MQGWDSVMIKADVELGGTDQLFNNLVGRDLQKHQGISPQVVLLLPILEGLDGVKKMSKSLGNYVGINESATEMFGKLMSISDELMAKYYLLLLGRELPTELHPLQAKKNLAARNCSHLPLAKRRRTKSLKIGTRVSAKSVWPMRSCRFFRSEPGDAVSHCRRCLLRPLFRLTKSRTEARRLIEQGSVQIRWRQSCPIPKAPLSSRSRTNPAPR